MGERGIESILPFMKNVAANRGLHERVELLVKDTKPTHSLPSFQGPLSKITQRIWDTASSITLKEVVKEHFIIVDYEYLKNLGAPSMEMFQEEFLDTEEGEFYMNNCWLLRRTSIRGGASSDWKRTFECLKVGVTRDVDLLMYQQYRSDPVSVSDVQEMCGVPLVVKATFITTRYTFSPSLYFDVIQLGDGYYVVGTVKRGNNPEHEMATQSLEDNNLWFPANSKIIEFICYSRNKNQKLWPIAPHETTYTAPQGLKRFYLKHDPLLPLSDAYHRYLETLTDILPDTDEKELHMRKRAVGGKM